MKKIIAFAILCFCMQAYTEQSKTIDSLTVEELTEIVRQIIQESLSKCVVTGSMKGRAKVNLAVIGSVEAKMSCNFDNELKESLENKLSDSR
tara:strand:- start:94 stop:369 length:276 start_codon:yes stop_codon:yes gene_type:complete